MKKKNNFSQIQGNRSKTKINNPSSKKRKKKTKDYAKRRLEMWKK